MMKKLLALFFSGVFFVLMGVDYSDSANWVICGKNPAKPSETFDVFYIYPTLFQSKDTVLMDWSEKKLAAKTLDFTRAQTCRIFGESARIFAPYVRQLEYSRCIDDLRAKKAWMQTAMKTGVEDTLEAFDYYLEHFNGGRPVILLGHSQGAMDLYMLLAARKATGAEKVIVAAYLPGLPGITPEKFAGDMKNSRFHPATGAGDIHAVVIWNTQSPDAEESVFDAPGSLCINPLNWKNDETPASAESNIEAMFYDWKNGKMNRVPHFCGAKINKTKGVLVVEVPDTDRYDANGIFGKGIFHMNDVWFFAGNLKANAILRVRNYQKAHPAK